MKNLNFEAEIFNSNKVECLYHIGSMNLGDKNRHFSDGNGLSVSTCPNVWATINSFSSNEVYKLYKKNVQLLDYYSLTENDFKLSISWGVSEGYLKESYIYLLNDENENIVFCDNFEEAQKKAKFYRIYKTYDEYLKYGNAESSYIEQTFGYIPTEKLKKISMVDVDLYNVININLFIFLEKNTSIDGVYWNDDINIKDNIAPRGVIFNSKIDTFKIKKLYMCEDCKLNIAEYEVIENKLCNKCKTLKYGKDILNKETGNYTCAVCSKEYFYGFGKCDCHDYIAK